LPRSRPRSPSLDGEIEFTRPWSRSPTESSHPPGGPVREHRIRLPRGSSPLRRHHPDPPRMPRFVPSRSGSAPRLSQPLSGFLAKSELGDLVSCRRRPWGSPFRALLLAGIACASRRRMLPCSSPPSYLRRDAPIASSGLRRRPRSWRGGLAAPRSSAAVSTARLPTLSREGLRRLPRRPGPAHRTHLVPAASSASKLSSPRESVRAARRFRGHATADALLGFAPPEP
jgi:hypothetical protein